MVICLERIADCLHMVQLMPLPSPKPHHLLPRLSPDWFYLSGTRLTKVVLEKRPLNGCSSSSYVSLRVDVKISSCIVSCGIVCL